MKLKRTKGLLLLAFIFAANQTAHAQLSLEHSYTKNYGVQVVAIEDEDNKYMMVDTGTKNTLLYNSDHSLWKRINTTFPADASLSAISCASKRLFNLDNDLELAFSYYSGGEPVTKIYKEDGSIIQSLPGVYYCIPVKVNSSWKLMAMHNLDRTDVYALPGVYLGITDPIGAGALPGAATLYPNPVETSATLKYTLPAGTRQATLNIYDLLGNIVGTYQVTDQFSDLLIRRESLPSGTYTYRISADNRILSGAKFIIK